MLANDRKESRADREVAHGIRLAADDAELAWGWGSPAGKRRAARRADLIADSAGVGPQSHVLEIGCGTGVFTDFFAGRGARIVAVDLSGELLQKARGRNLPPRQVQFVEAALEEFSGNEPFDAVIGSSVLHHLEVIPALMQIFALLRPGGRMSFAEPNLLNPQIFVERKFRRWFPSVSPDEGAFIRWRLKRTMLEAGFEQIQLQPFDWLHPATPEKFVPLVQGIGRLMEKIPLVREFSGSLLIAARRPPAGGAGLPG